jgi:hypothetical protein
MRKAAKRQGDTITFSVSVDRETKKLLRETADRSYRGNVSELISEIAHQAARQASAAELLRLHGRRLWTETEAVLFESNVEASLRVVTKRRRTAA